MGCTHFYCTKCTVRYITSKLDENITSISCPVSACEGILEPDYCRDILPKDVFDRWGIALCESVIDCSQKFYCPYEDCSVLLINDTRVEVENSVCPFCKREFCVKCKVPWHPEINCEKFQKLKKKGDDSLLVDLAKRKKWRRCPKCKYYVEKSLGCFYMKCRCVFLETLPSVIATASAYLLILSVDMPSVTNVVLAQALLPILALSVSIEFA
ncbi:hypothetical protein GH714_037952 [Hevea brasiliensis]|uniref:RBR-type E3 ubiquitin transferase n=1 Tax=Hevea brasiliensis TaxID=3981 RepID=A0A6A6KAI2_HEVBR|nr:hypothetical protein GH714_037952 [Hevea brasiliensis]